MTDRCNVHKFSPIIIAIILISLKAVIVFCIVGIWSDMLGSVQCW